MVDVKAVKRVAGQISWAAGLSTWIRSFRKVLGSSPRMHVGTVRNHISSERRRGQLFFVKIISLELSGLEATMCGRFNSSRVDHRTCFIEPQSPKGTRRHRLEGGVARSPNWRSRAGATLFFHSSSWHAHQRSATRISCSCFFECFVLNKCKPQKTTYTLPSANRRCTRLPFATREQMESA